MLKKFFVAMIVAVLMLTSQIVSAAEVDWSKVPRFDNKADFVRYVEEGRRRGRITFAVVLTSNSILPNAWKTHKINPQDFGEMVPCVHFRLLYGMIVNAEMRVHFRITEYPGTRVANAYLRGNTDYLTSDELQLYNKAVEIVNEAKKRPSIFAQEVYIHDEICRRTTYEGDKNTAIGALVYGKADCDGYADAFYMLCRMMGWNVGRVFGKSGNVNHAWNWIDFGDGKVYCVDVQADDECFNFGDYGKATGYLYFNAPEEITAVNHTWDRELLPNLQRTIDNRYSYRLLSNHAYVSSPQEGWNLIAQKLSDAGNGTLFYVMAPLSENRGNYSGRRIVHYTQTFGNYFIITAFAQ